MKEKVNREEREGGGKEERETVELKILHII